MQKRTTHSSDQARVWLLSNGLGPSLYQLAVLHHFCANLVMSRLVLNRIISLAVKKCWLYSLPWWIPRACLDIFILCLVQIFIDSQWPIRDGLLVAVVVVVVGFARELSLRAPAVGDLTYLLLSFAFVVVVVDALEVVALACELPLRAPAVADLTYLLLPFAFVVVVVALAVVSLACELSASSTRCCRSDLFDPFLCSCHVSEAKDWKFTWGKISKWA